MPSIGYCKLCHSEYAPAINKMIVDGKNSTEIISTMETFGMRFQRKTLGTHKKHITHPLITAVEASRRKPLVMPKTNQAVLESIRELGMRRAIDHPEEVTVDHALKAASILQQKEGKQEGILVVLAKAVMSEVDQSIEEYMVDPIDVTPHPQLEGEIHGTT